jgi:predicted phage terminase large subunit-like protein
MGTDPDFTSGTLVGIDAEGYTWILDQISFRGEPYQVEQMILDTARIDGKHVAIRAEQEGGASGKSHIATLGRKLAGYDFEGQPSTGDKPTRAYWFAGQVNKGNVRLLGGTALEIGVHPAPWHQVWLERHRTFPHGTHDDEVDSTSGGFNYLTGGDKQWSSPQFASV